MRYSARSLALLLCFSAVGLCGVALAESGQISSKESPDPVRDFQYKEALQQSQAAIGRVLASERAVAAGVS